MIMVKEEWKTSVGGAEKKWMKKTMHLKSYRGHPSYDDDWFELDEDILLRLKRRPYLEST